MSPWVWDGSPTTAVARWFARVSARQYAGVAAGVIVATAITLLLMGQAPICTCGYVKVWQGIALSSENSQHLSDWYTFSHVIHGFAFYAIGWLAGRQWPLALRFVLALLVEGAWEAFENTDFVINRYREATISLDYYGDSVINSVADIFAMITGFMTASRFPVWMVVSLTIGLEGFVAYFIRDNLALNIIMLIYPLDAIRQWQLGA